MVRVAAADALGRFGSNAAEEAVPALLLAVKTDEFWKVRAEAATALGMIGADQAKDIVESLNAASNDEADKLALAAIKDTIKKLGKKQDQAGAGPALPKDEQLLLDLINKYRLSQKVPPLLLSAKLCVAAQAWTSVGTHSYGATYGNDRFCISDVGLTPQVAFHCWMGTGGSVSSMICDKSFQYIGVCSGKGRHDHVYFAFLLAETPPKD
jgi:uncharacterized protein YkwD